MAINTYTAKALLVAFAVTGFLGLSLGLAAQGQDKKDDKKGEKPAPAKPAQGEAAQKADELAPYRLRSIVRLGYTRPGNIDDPRKDGKVVPVAQLNDTDKIVGGTVYFMVLERNTDRDQDRDRDRDRGPAAGDYWGTGISDFETRFIPGRNFDGGVSPQLDRRAKFIYLYQVVNDRGLDPRGGVAPAFYDKIRAQDVATFGLRLLVDPRFITSWGHFQATAFTAVAPNRNLINEVKQAADGKEEPISLAVSSDASILGELPQHEYRVRSPAYSLGKLGRSFEIGSDTLNLTKSSNYQYLQKVKGVVTAAFVNNAITGAAEGGKQPAFVQIMYFNGNETLPDAGNPAALGFGAINLGGQATAVDNTGARGIFRVDWRGDQFMKLGQDSVLFGFTTDMPPVDEPIAIGDREAALTGNGIRQVVADDAAITPAQGVAPGTAPTPAGGAAAGGAMVPGGTFGTMGGLGGGGMGGIGYPGGGIGMARGPLFGGGGGFGGGGSGSNNGTTPNQGQQGQQTGQQSGTVINVNSTLTNQQKQQQQQQQQQQQGQTQSSQSSSSCMTHGVVPAPASLLLGLLGLPGLWFLRRRTSVAA